MTINVNIKQLGKKRNKISGVPFFLEENPSTVRELISLSVKSCVSDYNKRAENGGNISPLSESQISDMSEIGKIAFGINYGEKKADYDKAVETALQAYEDGLFRIFIRENEVGSLSDSISLSENDSVTFIKLTMLSGRMW